jgi:hypothetical protein
MSNLMYCKGTKEGVFYQYQKDGHGPRICPTESNIGVMTVLHVADIVPVHWQPDCADGGLNS